MSYRVTDDENGPLVVVTSAIMMTYMILCCLVRIFMRFTINGPFANDDRALTLGSVFAIVQTGLKIAEAYAGLGRRKHLVPFENIEGIEKLAFAGDIFYLLAIAFSRVSTFLLIARLTRQKNHLRAAHLGAAGAVVIGLTSIFVICMRCDLSKPWDTVAAGCPQLYIRWYTVETLGILVEIYATWVPIYLVWSLQMRTRSKLVVLFAFSFRLPVLIAASMRLYYLRQQQLHDDFLFYGAAVSVSLEVELHYGLMAATIPCLKPFVKLFNTGYFDTKAIQSNSGREQYVLSHLPPPRTTVTADDKAFKRPWSERYHVRKQSSGSPSSVSSDRMVIRQTTAWDISYDTEDEAI